MAFKLFSLWGEVDAKTAPAEKKIAALQAQVGRLQGRFDKVGGGGGGGGAGFGRLSRLIHGTANGIRSATTGTRGLYAALSAAAAVAGGIAITRKAVIGASDLAETMQKVEVVFGSATARVVAGSEEMARAFGVGRGQFLDAAASLGLIAKAAGLTQERAATLSDRMARLAIDASSFYNVPLEEALIAMRAGLVGESEPLRRFGVLLNEAAVQNEALALGLARTKGQITEGAKVQARYSLITKGLADASGDLERTQGSMANRLRKIAGQFDNLFVSIGQKVLPIFVKAAEVISIYLGQLDEYLNRNAGHFAVWAAKLSHTISLVALLWREWPRFAEIATLKVQEFLLRMEERIRRVGATLWEGLAYGAASAATIIKNAFWGVEKYLETLFSSIAKNLVATLTQAATDLAKGAFGDILGFVSPAAAAGIKAMRKAGAAAVPVAPPIVGDKRGLTGEAIMAGVGPVPDFFKKFGEKLPDLAARINPLVEALQNLNVVDAFRRRFGIDDSWENYNPGKIVRGARAFLARPKTAVERLAEDDKKRSLVPRRKDGQPLYTDEQLKKKAFQNLDPKLPFVPKAKPFYLRPDGSLATDATSQRRAATILAARAKETSREAAREAAESRRNLLTANFGRMGQLGAGVNRLAKMAGLGRAGRVLGAIVGGAPGILGGIGGGPVPFLGGLAGGMAGFLGAAQDEAGRQPARRAPRAGRSTGRRAPFPWQMMAGGGPIMGEFRSEMTGLAEFSKKLSTDLLSREKPGKDPSVDLLGTIAESIGTKNTESGNSMIGILNRIANKPPGPGFAVGPA